MPSLLLTALILTYSFCLLFQGFHSVSQVRTYVMEPDCLDTGSSFKLCNVRFIYSVHMKHNCTKTKDHGVMKMSQLRKHDGCISSKIFRYNTSTYSDHVLAVALFSTNIDHVLVPVSLIQACTWINQIMCQNGVLQVSQDTYAHTLLCDCSKRMAYDQRICSVLILP